MTGRWRAAALAVVLASATALSGCARNPATGRETLSLISAEQESQMGRQQHPEVLRAFGGAYRDPALQAYVEGIGGALAAQSELAGQPFTFTILDSDIVNAMALPGGYVYVTRGLLSLANSEAELAGVIAHEIGHVTARHSAQRVSQSMIAGLGLAILGAVVDTPGLVDVAGLGAQAFLQKYSRDQEFEADTLGIRYMSRAGYDPAAMASFLDSLRRQAALEARLAGRSPDAVDAFNMMASHPRTVDRVQRAAEVATSGPPGEGRLGADDHLRRIDGMLYGDDPSQGVVRGRQFLHPTLGFAYEVPEGFNLINGRDNVVARHPDGAVIVFDGAPNPGGDMVTYLQRGWARGVRLAAMEPLDVNGMPAATGMTRVDTGAGPMDARLVAIAFDQRAIYRFLFITPPAQTPAWNEPLRRTTYSFRPLGRDEAASVRPHRIDLVQVRPGDTVESLAASLPFERLRLERFQALNGLEPGEPLRPGRLLKTVVQ